jgi:hypothetical protein
MAQRCYIGIRKSAERPDRPKEKSELALVLVCSRSRLLARLDCLPESVNTPEPQSNMKPEQKGRKGRRKLSYVTGRNLHEFSHRLFRRREFVKWNEEYCGALFCSSNSVHSRRSLSSCSRVLKDMSSLVGNISGLASQMQLWSEPLPPPIEFYHPRTASRTGASAASVANRGTGLVLAFRPRKAVLHSDSIVSGGQVRGLADESGSPPGMHKSIVDESLAAFVERPLGERPGTRGD